MSGKPAPIAILDVPHAPDCYAIKSYNEGKWPTPWAFHLPELVYRNAYGRETPKRRGYHPWVAFRCNCTHCPAIKLVRNNEVVIVGDEELD